jgi:hypothetical protein
VIEQARPDSLATLYRDLRLEVRYRHAIDGGKAIATIGVANECVRGATCAQNPRREVAHGCGDVRSPARISHRDAQVMDPDGSLTPLAGSSITRPRSWACRRDAEPVRLTNKAARRRSSRQSGRARWRGCVLSGRAAAEGLLRGRRGRRLFAVGAEERFHSPAEIRPAARTRTSTQRLSATRPVPCILFAPAVRAVT